MYCRIQILLVVLAIALAPLCARADALTPFLEGAGAELGAISDGHGYIIAAGESDDGPSFLVMVTSDTHEYLIINARAEKGIVPANLIGRPVLIKAEITKHGTKPGRPEGFELKILSAQTTRKDSPK